MSTLLMDNILRPKVGRAGQQWIRLILLLLLAVIAGRGYSCTMFRLTVAGKTLIGNNEDFRLPWSKYWVEPAEAGADGYGVLFFGFNTISPQGGMNERGLVFDGFSTPEKPVRNYDGKQEFSGNILRAVMKNCATVEEVEEFLGQYDLRRLSRAQLMFADAGGHSVIVEGDAMLHSEAPYQITTNFYQSEIDDPREIPCWRYLIAQRLLTGDPKPTVDFCTAVLDSVHAERALGGTQYSMVYDPEKKLVYLYLFHNFQERVTIDLNSEMVKGGHAGELVDLFTDTNVYEEYRDTYSEAETLSKQLQTERDTASLAELGRRFSGNRLAVHFANGVLNKAEILLKYKKYVRAAELFRVAQRLFPDSGACSLGLGESLAAQGDTTGARSAFLLIPEHDALYERARQLLNELRTSVYR